MSHDRILQEFLRRTPASEQAYRRACRSLPGGDTRSINYYRPYPITLDSGSGCVVRDVDGNEYLDFVNNYSALIHGHAHPAVTSAIAEQARRGTALGGPSRLHAAHAEVLCDRVPSFDKVRYTNSGTEATLYALRAARAFTRRDVVVKVDGGYHGTHDLAQINPFAGAPGVRASHVPGYFPLVSRSAGVPVATLGTVIVVPYNDLAAVGAAIDRHGGDIAAVIVEPMLAAGGALPAEDGYLSGLRALTRQHGIMLVFDEVATFRLGPLQRTLGVTPDITALGKLIGGGLPIGAFGGRDDVLAMFDPARSDAVFHSGTFAGNDIGLAAGLAALEHYQDADIVRLNALGEDLITRLSAVAAELGVRGSASGYGSYGQFHWGEGPLRDAVDVHARQDGLSELMDLFHWEMLNRGVFFSRRFLFCLSTPMRREHVDAFVDAFAKTLDTLRPYIRAHCPQLLLPAAAARSTSREP